MKNIYIIGAGGYGAVVAELAVICGYNVAGFIDDNPARHGSSVLGWKVLGGLDCIPDGATVAFGVGNNEARRRCLETALLRKWHLPVLVHPSAVVSPSAQVGAGTVVLPQALLSTRSCVGSACIINNVSSVSHDCVIGDIVHVCPGVRLAGGVVVGDGTLIGIGSSVRQLMRIGADCLIGAGSVVVKDIPDNMLAYGNPAVVRASNKGDRLNADRSDKKDAVLFESTSRAA